MQNTILVIEDNAEISSLLHSVLRSAGYQVILAFSGTEAKLLLEQGLPDLILLDLMLPGLSGEDFLKDFRAHFGYRLPVIILSAKSLLEDKVHLLQSGADDYITKPFEPEELLARISVRLRKSDSVVPADRLTYKNLELFPTSRKVLVSGIELFLTAHEFELLHLLIKNPEKVYSRELLYELVWKDGYYGENNTVNVHISNLRKKIKAADDGFDYIRTVYGIGFKLE